MRILRLCSGQVSNIEHRILNGEVDPRQRRAGTRIATGRFARRNDEKEPRFSILPRERLVLRLFSAHPGNG